MKTKRVLSFILAVMMLFSVCAFSATAEESVSLTDIDLTTPVGKAVSRLVSMGIINGYPDETYRPDNSITRAEFSVVMVKFLGAQDYIDPNALTGFEDLDTDANYAWARPYVAMAIQRGIINGFEDKTFRAADPVTYEQAIKMLVCSLGYGEKGQAPTIAGDWSSGYVTQAMKLGITTGTTSSITLKTQPTTRGTVAILVSNALEVETNETTTGTGDTLLPGNQIITDLEYTEVKGIVTGTFITELEDARSTVPKDHIMIDDEVYEIGFSSDPNQFLGCEVKAVINKDTDGDYPVATSLSVTSKTNTLEIEADFIGEYINGVLEYQTKRDGVWKEAKINDEYITIFNNKYYPYEIERLNDELVSGNVVLVDNDGDKRYDVIRINSYEVFVVASRNSTTQKVTLMYDAEYEGSTTMTFPEDSTSLIFSLTRNGKEIKFSDIAKWDVLNIKASPEDAAGRRYYEVVVTRQTVSGDITECDADDPSVIVIGDTEYVIADSFMEYEGDDKPSLEVGEYAQVYLSADGKIVAAAETTSGNSSEAYAYLYALRQDSDDSEYDLEFKLYTTSGKFIEIGSAAKITIDGTKYKALDEDILDYLAGSAEKANAAYGDAENVNYRQPIIYCTNSEGLVSEIHTVLSETNDGISLVMDGASADYEERQYKSSSKSFTDFKVSSSTKIMFIPDDRSDSKDYLTFSSYSKAFSNGRDYHVAGFGLTTSGKTAALVLIYKENDSRIYTSSTPFMIVKSKSVTANGTFLEGYVGSSSQSISYSEKTITVSEEDGPSISAIGKGDLIRYIVDSKGEIIDYEIWFDASDPAQLESCSDVDEAIDSRILEIHSTSTEPKTNYPSATFRLQYGTVTELVLDEDGSIDEETITVAPTIVEDSVDMVYDGDGVVSRTIGSSVKVFYFDRSARNSDVVEEADLSEILDYVDYGEDATRVITYSYSGTLRMVYIIAG